MKRFDMYNNSCSGLQMISYEDAVQMKEIFRKINLHANVTRYFVNNTGCAYLNVDLNTIQLKNDDDCDKIRLYSICKYKVNRESLFFSFSS